jgi:gluconate kinase
VRQEGGIAERRPLTDDDRWLFFRKIEQAVRQKMINNVYELLTLKTKIYEHCRKG